MLTSKEGPSLGLTNGYIYNFLAKETKSPKGGRIFKDVYAADTIPIKLLSGSEKCICICNTSQSTEKGSHFLTLLIERSSITVYDSLVVNLKIASPALYKSLKDSKKPIHNAFQKPLQGAQSIHCGFYCIYFALQLSHRVPEKLLKPFDYSKRTQNDRNVIENIKIILRYIYKKNK